jgi:hypothetical protein
MSFTATVAGKGFNASIRSKANYVDWAATRPTLGSHEMAIYLLLRGYL